jgi:hypothetical protein
MDYLRSLRRPFVKVFFYTFAGCKIFDIFVPAGSTQAVYGRECECSNDSDEKGRIVKVKLKHFMIASYCKTKIKVIISVPLFPIGEK